MDEPQTNHLVQFYEDEDLLTSRVAGFAGRALTDGAPVVIVATEPHRQAFQGRLESAGFDVSSSFASGQLVFLDAQETLAKFTRNGELDERLFEFEFGELIAKQVRAAGPLGLRAYGEMVDVLWRKGERRSAIQLEELWNRLQSKHAFTLFCSYGLANFAKEPADLERVCALHTHVMRSGETTDAGRAEPYPTSLPPQHARRLAQEIARRKELERALQSSLGKLAVSEEERRSAEATLRESVQQLELVMDALPALVSYVDAEHRYRFASGAYQRWFGFSRADIVGRHVADVLGPDAYAVVRPQQARALAGETVTYETEITYPDGRSRFVEAKYVPQEPVGGVVPGFVALVSDITERKNFEHFRQQAAARAERLAKITAAIADAVTSNQVFEAVVDRLHEAVGANSAALWLVDEDGKTARLVRVLGYPDAVREQVQVVPLDVVPPLPVIDAILRREAVWIDSQAELLRQYPHLASIVPSERSDSLCCLPLIAHGRALGTLALSIEGDRRIDEDEQAFFLLAARYASQAVERLRLFDAERRSRGEADAAAQRMGVLSEASRVFVETDLELGSRLEGIVGELGSRLESCVGVALLEPDGLLHWSGVYHPVPEARGRLAVLTAGSPLRVGEGITGSVVATGKSVLIPSITLAEMLERAAPAYRDFLERYPTYAMICAPLRSRGQVIGAVVGTRTQLGQVYTSDDLLLFEQLAERAAGAIENSRLYQGMVEARLRAEQLYRFAQALVAAEKVETVFDAALGAIEAALGARRASILTFDQSGVMRFVAWRNLSEGYRRATEGHSPWLPDTTGPEPILVTEAQNDPRMAAYAELFQAEGIGALAFIPLVASGRLLGKFMVYYDEPHAFASYEVETASAIANHLASVIVRFSAVAKLEEQIRANELFAGVLAHDLLNPLGAITTGAQLLLKRREGEAESDAHEAKSLGRILSSGQRMTRMIDQLLDFTRARTGGGISIQPRQNHLGELCTQVLGELELAHPEWTIQSETAGDLRGVWDGDRLLQIISNLVANAGQHGVRSHGILVRLDGTDSGHVRLDVHNRGSIPLALLPELFDPFRSARIGRDRSRGLGLGLFIVRELVVAHGGTVDVSSEDHRTTFSVRLPRHTSAGPARTALEPVVPR